MPEIFITKYAETRGVLKAEAMIDEKGYASGRAPDGMGRFFFSKTEYALTVEEAWERARKRLDRKVKSLRAQIARVEAQRDAIGGLSVGECWE